MAETAMERLDRLISLGWGDYRQDRIPPAVLAGDVEDFAPEVRERRPRGSMRREELDSHAEAMRERPEARGLNRKRQASIDAWERRRADL